jgi:hypothetical protein
MESCGICYPYPNEFKGMTECIKPHAHNDFHVFRTENGGLIAWEDDDQCGCGCWDDWEKGDGLVCTKYWQVNENFEHIEFT